MTKKDGIIFEGEKLGIEKLTSKDNKPIVRLHILSGFESTSIKVNDNNLVKLLDEYPVRKPLKIKASVSIYNQELYFTATSIIN